MKIKCYTAVERFNRRPNSRTLSEEQIDEATAYLTEITREDFEAQILKIAREPDNYSLGRVRYNRRMIGLVTEKYAYFYELESELAAAVVLQLYKHTRKEALKKP